MYATGVIIILVAVLYVLFWIAVSAGIVYLFILIVKALKKYVNSKEVREEKKAVAKSLGEALKENRIRCQMTQEFVAETLGVSRQSVSKWENGSSDPNTSNLIALAKLYKISPEELLECATRTPEED
ncbi:MAG: helix-turn-helix domain-containing protein [Gemmiger sp.]|uniref:helix-turn-helix domain-containing protein n=1 Tax=uncultured Gemmiger sp. TaxID=1623490 RepID=UPI0028043479|nr:helix-turn-helix transcriptional regulator [uncultured Gemmiger sp.]